MQGASPEAKYKHVQCSYKCRDTVIVEYRHMWCWICHTHWSWWVLHFLPNYYDCFCMWYLKFANLYTTPLLCLVMHCLYSEAIQSANAYSLKYHTELHSFSGHKCGISMLCHSDIKSTTTQTCKSQAWALQPIDELFLVLIQLRLGLLEHLIECGVCYFTSYPCNLDQFP